VSLSVSCRNVSASFLSSAELRREKYQLIIPPATTPAAISTTFHQSTLGPEHPPPPRHALSACLSLCVAKCECADLTAPCAGCSAASLACPSGLWLVVLGLPLVGWCLDLWDALRELGDDDVTPPDLLVPGGHDLTQVGDLIT
jgi:hypothetical protein